ncbi:uncharacterized protein N7458_002605 [Penicillium daleae]|uniref:Protein kinase domain-containing protein n=1 Tax=Penicillium daleae TaxID=63821 RepID=A0AAD6CDE0_9EURO|nr:uncharacterized protein N7458_002605 [Penicillium daleae]KAJ5461053.1 hypothetical protein N7458_002605 [Penicillium daleae]
MLSSLWRFYSAAQVAFRYFSHLGYRSFGLLSRICPRFIGYHPSKSDNTDDLEANDPVGVVSTSNCDTYTIRLHPQRDLQIRGFGASAQVYEVDDEVVLKTSWVFERPGSSAPDGDRWHYASDTLFHSNLLQNERTVLRVLQGRPHPHIMEAIDADQPEGIYLRRYHSLSGDKIVPQPHRIRWYCDLTDALCHIHSLGIAHADVRIENVLFDDQDGAILCDFSAASPLGQPNPVFPDLPLPVNGPSPTLSEATEMFAMASLIFQMEHGAKPELSVDSHDTLVLPKIKTDYQSLETIIRKAWLGHYNRTSEMLEDLSSIDTNGTRPARDIKLRSESTESLRDRIKKWREGRENKFGKGYPLYDVYILGG